MSKSTRIHLWDLVSTTHNEADESAASAVEESGRVNLAAYNELRPFVNNYSCFQLVATGEYVRNALANTQRNAFILQEKLGQVRYIGEAIVVFGMWEMQMELDGLQPNNVPAAVTKVIYHPTNEDAPLAPGRRRVQMNHNNHREIEALWNTIVVYRQYYAGESKYMLTDFLVVLLLCIAVVLMPNIIVVLDLLMLLHDWVSGAAVSFDRLSIVDVIPLLLDVLLPFIAVIAYLLAKPLITLFRKLRVHWAVWHFKTRLLQPHVQFYVAGDVLVLLNPHRAYDDEEHISFDPSIFYETHA